MKRVLQLLVLIAALVAFAAPSAAQIETHSFYSESLHRVATYSIYVPKKKKEDERFPSLYILHGAYGSNADWPTRTNVAELATRYRMILVFPDGSQFGWYVDSKMEKYSNYETFVSDELRRYVDTHYPTIDDRNARGIMGLSMGGHGALSLAAKHPNLYASASSLSGILKLTNHPSHWSIPDRLGDMATHEADWKANSVYELCGNFRTGNVSVLFDCGVDDTKTGAIVDARDLHARMTELKIPHIYRELPGTHSWEYWSSHLQDHLNFHQAKVLASKPGEDKWFTLYYDRIGKFLDENAQLAIEGGQTSPTLCLLGSSSMQGMPSDLFPGFRVFNRGISADRLGLGTRGISQRLEESAMDMKPDVVFLKCARNDLAARKSSGTPHPTDDELAEATKSIINRIRDRHPGTLIILGDAFPVRDKYAHLAPFIEVFAERQRAIAKELGVPLVDGHGALIGGDGLLKPENSADGLHLSQAGKKIVADMILAEIQKARPDLMQKTAP
ncbi:hypothetical protein IT570_08025 [Candidatus Sumerlaeota bacterium]|nr:hypothetical protein [Candidatus Sumerlaeota bacterium]